MSSQLNSLCVRLIGPTLEQILYASSNNPEIYLHKLVLLHVHLGDTCIGKLSLMFQRAFSKDPVHTISNLSEDSADWLPEVYSNPSLSTLEREKFQRAHIREYNAMLKAISEGDLENASQYYRSACLHDCLEYSEDVWKIPPTQFFIEHGTQHHLWLYCLPTLDLLKSVITDSTNPLTGIPYTGYTLNKVCQKFGPELKVLKYVLHNST